MTEPSSDVVVVGAGIVGAACAFYAARAGLSVTVLERGTAGVGTTSRGEGNVLVSDKGPGAELDLALLSRQLWLDVADEMGAHHLELERKGGLVVATCAEKLKDLERFAQAQRGAGVEATRVPSTSLNDYEPHLADDLAGGMHYPQDLQVQPVLAASALLRAARSLGARWFPGVEVTGLHRSGDAMTVLASDRRFPTRAVVNATGTWGGQVATTLGGSLPVLPRRGFVLVTEPLPRVVRHKVYSADYVNNVASGDAGLETSAVIEGTQGGTVLIGASRERVGFDDTLSPLVVRRLAAQAVRLFPFLADVALMRVYRGFRPYCPDHLPVIGPDLKMPGLFHACGHEGAGIGLAPATGLLISQLLTGEVPALDPTPFAPARFEEVV